MMKSSSSKMAKESLPVEVGQRYEDRDKRRSRVLTITQYAPGATHVLARTENGPRKVRIAVQRLLSRRYRLLLGEEKTAEDVATSTARIPSGW